MNELIECVRKIRDSQTYFDIMSNVDNLKWLCEKSIYERNKMFKNFAKTHKRG